MSFAIAAKSHKGKTSDKWLSYLSVYDAAVNQMQIPIKSVFEIGVQNGGSLEIWASMLPNAKVIVGADINKDCKKLEFQDKRISVVVGDATTKSISKKVQSLSSTYDLIVDDGSHDSRDIINAFIRYFPMLTPGGTYIVEDLHASYWAAWHGGLAEEKSAISFLKKLVDVVNEDHWGIEKIHSHELFRDYSENIPNSELGKLGTNLELISSILFVDSVCVIHTYKKKTDRLGKRTQLGTGEDIVMPTSILKKPIELANIDISEDTEQILAKLNPHQQKIAWDALSENIHLKEELFAMRSTKTWRYSRKLIKFLSPMLRTKI